MKLNKLCVIGVGLIGGSFALKLKQLDLVKQVVGYGRNRDNLQTAVDMGVIDQAAESLQAAVEGADLVVLAVPIASIAEIYAQIYPHLSSDTLVTDVGSAKTSVIESVQRALGEMPPNFVPGHPIAGREKSGVEAVEADLYQNHRVILTPLEKTNKQAVQTVRELWQAVGAEVTEMSSRFHDEVFAATSHLPHMLAFALVDMLNEHSELGNVFQYTAGGFRDFTRIASSDATMWRDIAVNNGDAIVKWIEEYQRELSKLSALISDKNADALFELFSDAKAARDKHIVKRKP
jgi:prephenate dehydrogenase